MAINQLYCSIADNLDNKLHTVGIFLDLSKAFDTINPAFSINFTIMATEAFAHDWIKSYLSGRQQCVAWAILTLCPTQPPSLVEFPRFYLGPSPFLLYINDLPLCSKTPRFILFADDTNILLSHYDPEILESLINTELQHISNWY